MNSETIRDEVRAKLAATDATLDSWGPYWRNLADALMPIIERAQAEAWDKCREEFGDFENDPANPYRVTADA